MIDIYRVEDLCRLPFDIADTVRIKQVEYRDISLLIRGHRINLNLSYDDIVYTIRSLIVVDRMIKRKQIIHLQYKNPVL